VSRLPLLMQLKLILSVYCIHIFQFKASLKFSIVRLPQFQSMVSAYTVIPPMQSKEIMGVANSHRLLGVLGPTRTLWLCPWSIYLAVKKHGWVKDGDRVKCYRNLKRWQSQIQECIFRHAYNLLEMLCLGPKSVVPMEMEDSADVPLGVRTIEIWRVTKLTKIV